MMSKHRTKLLAGAAAAVLITSGLAIGASDVHWSYHGDDGPEFWGFLLDDSGHIAFPTCAVGESQSPVDISKFDEEDDGPSIRFDYEATPLVVKNNGHTIEVEYEPGSSISIDGDTYNLLQFHFHTPSEHTVLGAPYPMEGHLVHARGEGDDVELAVVGFLISEGDHNDVLQGIWDVMPASEGIVEADGETIDASDLVPSDSGEEYYAYSGSLTTPPCSEGVRWQVLKEPIEASAAQIADFQEIFDMNARPVQDLLGREISLIDD